MKESLTGGYWKKMRSWKMLPFPCWIIWKSFAPMVTKRKTWGMIIILFFWAQQRTFKAKMLWWIELNSIHKRNCHAIEVRESGSLHTWSRQTEKQVRMKEKLGRSTENSVSLDTAILQNQHCYTSLISSTSLGCSLGPFWIYVLPPRKHFKECA